MLERLPGFRGGDIVHNGVLAGLLIILAHVVLYLIFPAAVSSYLGVVTEVITYEIAQVVLSASLVLVTTVYVVETRKQTEEMERDRRERYKPIIRPTVEPQGIANYNLAVENTGKGPAYDVKAEWWMEGEREDAVRWKVPILSPDERRRFRLPTADATTLSEIQEKYGNDDVLHFEASFDDGLGRSHPPETEDDDTTVSIKLSDTIASRQNSAQFLERDELGEIRQELKNIADVLDETGPRGSIPSELREIRDSVILGLLEHLGPLKFRELQQYSGLSRDSVSTAVHRLSTLGLVDYDEEVSLRSDEGLEVEVRYTGEKWD